MLRRRFLYGKSKPQNALYWYGDECNSLTGGWSEATLYPQTNVDVWVWDSAMQYTIRNVTKNEKNLYVKVQSNRQGSSEKTGVAGSFWCRNLVNVTNFTKLKVLIDIDIINRPTTSASRISLGYSNGTNPLTQKTSVDRPAYPDIEYRVSATQSSYRNLEIEVDVSSISGNVSIGFGGSEYSSSLCGREMKLHAMWLE